MDLSKVYFGKAQRWIEIYLYFLILLLLFFWYLSQTNEELFVCLCLGLFMYLAHIFTPKYSNISIAFLFGLIIFQITLGYIWGQRVFSHNGIIFPVEFTSRVAMVFYFICSTCILMSGIILFYLIQGHSEKIRKEKEEEILDRGI